MLEIAVILRRDDGEIAMVHRPEDVYQAIRGALNDRLGRVHTKTEILRRFDNAWQQVLNENLQKTVSLAP